MRTTVPESTTRRHRAEGGIHTGDHDARQPWDAGVQGGQRGCPRVRLPSSGDAVGRRDVHSGVMHRRQVTGFAATSGVVPLGAAEVPDVAVAELEKVLGRKPGSRCVRQDD